MRKSKFIESQIVRILELRITRSFLVGNHW